MIRFLIFIIYMLLKLHIFTDSKSLACRLLNNILHKYLSLELGKTKKIEFNMPLLTRSKRVFDNESKYWM